TTARDNVLLASRADVARFREQEAAWKQRLKAAGDKLNNWLAEQKQPLTAALRNAKIDVLAIGDEEKKLLKEEPDSEPAKILSKQHEKALALSDDDYRRAFSDEQRRVWDGLKGELEAAKGSQPASPPTALAITDKKREPDPTWLLARGDFY